MALTDEQDRIRQAVRRARMSMQQAASQVEDAAADLRWIEDATGTPDDGFIEDLLDLVEGIEQGSIVAPTTAFDAAARVRDLLRKWDY